MKEYICCSKFVSLLICTHCFTNIDYVDIEESFKYPLILKACLLFKAIFIERFTSEDRF